jgi:hypothetical protein
MAYVSGCRAFWLAVFLTGLVIAASGAAGGHAARAAAYQAPALDTVFYLTDTAGLRVVEVTPDSVITENVNKSRFTWIAGMLVNNLPADDRARLGALFPLSPGGHFGYTGQPVGNASSRIEVTVEGPDTLDVGGKPMPVMRVTRHHKGVPPSPFEGEYTIWYSVAYGFPLKMSYRHIAGGKPDFRDWQVVHIAAPGSPDGVWSFRVTCPFEAYLSLERAVVRDGVVLERYSATPNGRTITQHDFRVTRVGDEIALEGSAMAALLKPVTVSARGTLMGRSVAGNAIANGRSGCSFTGERY